MPLSQQQKDWVVTQSGYSPTTHQLDDDGYISEKRATPAAQPTVVDRGTPQPKIQAMGGFGTFVKEGIHSAPAAAMGGVGAVLGGAAGGALISGPMAPLGAIVGGIAGGLGLGAGTSYLQGKAEEAIVPEYVQQMEANRVANPISALGGRLASMPLGGMNANLANVGKAAGTAATIAQQARLDGIRRALAAAKPSDLANLGNVGIGAGLGTGMAVGQQVAGGKSLSDAVLSMDTLEGLIGGSVFNKPNAIGNRMGFHDVVDSETPHAATTAQLMRTQAAQQQGAAKPLVDLNDPRIAAAKVGLTEKKEGKAASLDKTDLLSANAAAEQRGINPTKAAELEAQRVAQAGLLTPEQIYQQKVQKELERLASLRRKADFEKATLELQQQQKQAQAEIDAAQAAKATAKAQQQVGMKLGIAGQPEAIAARGITALPENRPATPRGNNKRVAAMRDPLPADPLQETADAVEEAYRTQKVRQEPEEGAAAVAPIHATELSQQVAKSKAAQPVDDFVRTVFDAQAKSRGADVTQGTEEGSFALVSDQLKRMAAEIGTKEAPDTRAHEAIGHIFVRMLKLSPYKSDKLIYKQALAHAEASPELKAIQAKQKEAGRRVWDTEEFIANQQGLEWLMANPAVRGETSGQKWRADFKAKMKGLLGNATPADIRRLVNYKWHNDAPFAEYFGKHVADGGVTAGATTRVSQVAQPADEGFNSKEGDDIFSNNEDIPVNDALPIKLPPAPEGYRRVKVVKPDGGSYEAFFNNKYYDMGEIGKFASIAKMTDKGLTHGATGKGETIEELPSQLYRRDQPVDEGVDRFEELSKKIGWKSNVKDPTPGSMQHDQPDPYDHSAMFEAVLSGRKPITTTYVGFEELPPGLQLIPIKNKNAQAWVGTEAVVRNGDIESFNNLMKAVASRNQDEVGRALGYTEAEIAEFNARNSMIDIYERKAGRVNQPSDEGAPVAGRTRTKEEHTAAQIERNRKAKEELAAIRGNIKNERFAEPVNLLNKTGRPNLGKSSKNNVSLDMPLPSGQGKLQDIIADPNAEMPGESIAETKLGDIKKVGAKETLEERIARKADEQLARLQEQAPDHAAAQEVAVVPKHVASSEVVHTSELDHSYAHMGEIVEVKLKTLADDRAEAVEMHGEDSAQVEKIDAAIEKQQKMLDWISKQDLSAKVDLKKIQKVFQPADEGAPVAKDKADFYAETGYVGKGLLHTIASEVDKLKQVSPVAGKAAESFLAALRARRGELEGGFNYDLSKVRKAHSIKEYIYQDNPDFQAVVKWRDAMMDSGGKEPFALTPTQQKINDVVSKSLKQSLDLRESFKTEGDIEGLATGKKGSPNYLPHVMSRIASNVLAENPTSPAAQKLFKEFLDYRTKVKGQTEAEATKNWKTIRDSFNQLEEGNIAARFGAIDKAMGKGLPQSMREQNLMDRMGRFNRRFARRVAYHETIQRNKEAHDKFFNSESGLASTRVGKNVLQDMFGIREHQEATRSALSGNVRALMLGPLTGAKDVVAGQVLGLQHMGLAQVLPAKLSALANYSKSYEKAVRTGVVRQGYGGLESGEGGLKNIQNVLGRSRDIINQVQGRQMLETVSRVLNYGEGRHLALDAFNAIHDGRLDGTKRGFLDDFVPDWQKYKKGEVPENVIDEAAAKFVESVQGTYDYRGLPEIAMKGTLSPYLSLARWNIEKFNNFTKHVVQPATKGNYKPLLMATLGAFIGGSAVNALVAEVTGRKERTANWDEIAESKEQLGLIGYKLASLASLAGYSGMLGDLVKSGFDAHYKNRVQTFSNPLVDAGGTILEDGKFLVQAMQEGDMPALTDVLHLLATDFIQAYRIALPHASEEKKNELEATNKRRDLKVWKMGEGMPLADSTLARPNPLIGKDARQFKQTEDIGEAAGLLPTLIDKAIKKATDAQGNIDPEMLKAELNKYKRNSYQTVPSPEQSPIAASKYMNWLGKTQGTDEASRRIEDYVRRNAINRAKSSMIPSL